MTDEAAPKRKENCGLCGCEDEPYLPDKWEGCGAVNCIRRAWLIEQKVLDNSRRLF